ncbi:MAG: LytTR family transcriptional regulator DNA-binding domain-containing protein [Bacteroidetes bacterium]|nr:LytTR family transcriptional regulator DNA-binding domain-containing protein [Bacteroidota bacterium]
MQTLRAIIVDDEPLARERFRLLLAEADGTIDVIAECGNGSDAVAAIDELKPDVVFLDIQMPMLDGFDVVELIGIPRPRIVFVTAYDQFAIRAFEVHALDYLTKPVRLGRLNMALARLHDEQARRSGAEGIDEMMRERSTAPLARLVVRAGRRLRVVPLDQVRWIEARNKLVYAHTAGGAHLIEFTLDEIEARLDPRMFIRAHRSHIVNASAVKEIVPWFAGRHLIRLDDGTELPAARRRVRDVKRMLGG